MTSIRLTGQWLGHFSYGLEYGDKIFGEKVYFRLFLEDIGDGQFKGTSVDVEGFGANMETAIIKGFIDSDFISFTKEYPNYYLIDENEKKYDDSSTQKPRLSYKGNYNENHKTYNGQWEFWINEVLDGDRGSFVDIYTGTWEMRKDE